MDDSKLDKVTNKYTKTNTISMGVDTIFLGIDRNFVKDKDFDDSKEQTLFTLRAAPQIAAAITANARVYMWEKFLKNRAYQSILYTDTDSIFILKEKDDIPPNLIHPTVMGAHYLKKERGPLFQSFTLLVKKSILELLLQLMSKANNYMNCI